MTKQIEINLSYHIEAIYEMLKMFNSLTGHHSTITAKVGEIVICKLMAEDGKYAGKQVVRVKDMLTGEHVDFLPRLYQSEIEEIADIILYQDIDGRGD